MDIHVLTYSFDGLELEDILDQIPKIEQPYFLENQIMNFFMNMT